MNTRDKLYVMEQVDRHNEAAVAGYCAERKGEKIAGATQPVLSREGQGDLYIAVKAHADAAAEMTRMEERREEIARRPVKSEERRQRFLRRLDAEIAEVRRREVEALHTINSWQASMTRQ